jgi:hypothetical protein
MEEAERAIEQTKALIRMKKEALKRIYIDGRDSITEVPYQWQAFNNG